nr:hypothetical protein [Tanacetum cinerariifolium]
AYGTDGPRSSDKGLTKGRMCGAVLRVTLLTNGWLCGGLIGVVLAGLRLVVYGCLGVVKKRAEEAFGDSDRGWGTGKRLQGSGGSGCTDDVEFSGWGFEGEVSGRYLLHAKLAMPYGQEKGRGLVNNLKGGCVCCGGVTPVVSGIGGGGDGDVLWVSRNWPGKEFDGPRNLRSCCIDSA